MSKIKTAHQHPLPQTDNCPPVGLYHAHLIAHTWRTEGFKQAEALYKRIADERKLTLAETVMLATKVNNIMNVKGDPHYGNTTKS